VFNHQILLVAVASLPDDEGMTDESLLLEMSGFDVAVVEGDVSNIKITHPADMAVAEALIEREIAK
jgi:2-C-methyl-D-erythritol 4-phosphate cytidylyltransferase